MMMTSEFAVPIPGKFRDVVAYLDLETAKVPAPPGFKMQNGEPLRMRWSIDDEGNINITEKEGPAPFPGDSKYNVSLPPGSTGVQVGAHNTQVNQWGKS